MSVNVDNQLLVDFENLVFRAKAAAKTPAERENVTRVRNAVMDTVFQQRTPVMRAFHEPDGAATATAHTAQQALNNNIEAMAMAMPMQPINSSFSLVVDRLPASVQAVLERLDDQIEQMWVQNHAFVDEKMSLIEKRGKALQTIQMRTTRSTAAAYGYSTVLEESDPEIVRLRREIQKIDAKMAKVDAKIEALGPRRELDKLRDRCRDFVRYCLGHGIALELSNDKPPKKPADIVRSIADVRERLAGHQADLRQWLARPRRSVDVKAAARKLVEATAKAPQVAQAVDHGDPIQWPVVGVMTHVVGGIELDGRKIPFPNEGAAGFGATPDVLGMLMWVFREPVLAAIDHEIDKYADDENSLSDADRAKGEAELRAKILDAERDEEALIRIADEKELPVTRRRDADPRAVLGLASTLPALTEDF